MKRTIVAISVFLALALSNCKEEQYASYMTNQKAAEYFDQIEEICAAERSNIWGTNLYGPLMMIDRSTRKIFSNAADAEGILKPKDGIFTGTYPKELAIPRNVPETFGGTLFGMVRLRSNEDEYRITTDCIHSLFHCFQVQNQLDTPDFLTSHLKERTVRFWVKMEWRALRRAIRTSGDIRKQAIRDALVFRSARREMYPRFIEHENSYENWEGLTAFTYIYIYSDNYDEYVRQLLNFYDRIYGFRSYERSWGFLNGALYSHLLFESGFNFQTISERNIDLGELTRERYDITLPEISRDIAGSLAFNYDIDLINREENEREVRLRESLWESVSKFVDRPVIFLELESPNFSFEPGDETPVDTLGTIYNTLTVSDNWGKIAVDEGGCLVSPDLEFIRVPAKGINSDRNHISGDGWHIILNESWELVEFDENYIIRKLLP